jgi:hypothetical protein
MTSVPPPGGIPVGGEALLRFDEIDVVPTWNTRLPANVESWFGSETDPQSSGLEGLAKSLQAHGQQTAVDVRPIDEQHFRWGKTELRWSLVCGFRRIAALVRIHAMADKALFEEGLSPSEEPLVPGLLRNHVRVKNRGVLSEQAAFAMNTIENGPRNSLTPPELLRAIIKGTDEFKMSIPQLATNLGVRTDVVRGYLRMVQLDPVIVKHWTEGGTFDGVSSGRRVKIEDMMELAKIAKWDQPAKYKSLVRPPVPESREHQTRMERLIQTAEETASALGELDKIRFATVTSSNWTDAVTVLCKKEHVTLEEARLIAAKAKLAYEKASGSPAATVTHSLPRVTELPTLSPRIPELPTLPTPGAPRTQ